MNPVQIGKEALWNAYNTILGLGDAGRKKDVQNQFGDQALRGDIAAEEAVISTLQQYNLPGELISEEHGVVELAEEPKHLCILDGIDGSHSYLHKTGHYGTMLAIFDNTNPLYDDYLFCGILDHEAHALYFTEKGLRRVVKEHISGDRRALAPVGITSLEPGMRMHVDYVSFDLNKRTFNDNFPELTIEDTRSTSAHHINVLTGHAIAMGECTRKMNLELAVTYGLHKEHGSAMITVQDGKDLGQKRYRDFCYHMGPIRKDFMGYTTILTADTLELAQEMRDRIL